MKSCPTIYPDHLQPFCTSVFTKGNWRRIYMRKGEPSKPKCPVGMEEIEKITERKYRKANKTQPVARQEKGG